MSGKLNTPIEYLKGIGPKWGELLNQELNIFTFGDLLQHYPFRHEDRSRVHKIKDINGEMPFIQIKGHISIMEMAGAGNKKRLVANFRDDSGELELVWFRGFKWITEKIKPRVEYYVFGKPNRYGRKLSIAHPELTPVNDQKDHTQDPLLPVYATTEKLKKFRIDSRVIARLQKRLLEQLKNNIPETLSPDIMGQFSLISKEEAIFNYHYPPNYDKLEKARFRLKFEELFYIQLQLMDLKKTRQSKAPGQVFSNTELLNQFYKNHLPFDLTSAQKRVIKEIYKDLGNGFQMNRLLQGDVGSGKTMVAFIAMLFIVGSGAQVALMAPTEILAEQHYRNLYEFCRDLGLNIALLTGSTKKSQRILIDESLRNGDINILVGTHALLEESVQFNNLGMSVIDEQHRFGVAQRAKLWQKNTDYLPHILVMTATPIPRTLAMTLYGDLDVSVIDEMPAGRKPVKTVHRYDAHRLKVFKFLKDQIREGRQVYIVYPLIEESENLDYKDLEDGYHAITRAFPDLSVSCVHGKMKPAAKEYEMKRFAKGETKIMVATTVIEVGVDVPNASVMVIENAERFGLAQLHQLRGRVGRGASQSYCILMTGYKLSKEGKIRIETMVNSTDGFDIADQDLKLRGPGDLMGTQQSGVLELLVADLGKDGQILQTARGAAKALLDNDPKLEKEKNQNIKRHITSLGKNSLNWSRIS